MPVNVPAHDKSFAALSAANHAAPADPGMAGSSPASRSDADWVLVGRISKTVGLQGMMRIILYSDYPDRYVPGACLFVRDADGGFRRINLGDVREQAYPGRIDAFLEGVSTLEDARAYHGKELYIPMAERARPRNGEFYPDELAGMTVQFPAGTTVGTVVRLENEVPSPYLVISSESHGEVMIPFRKVFIRTISRADRVVQLCEPLEKHVLG